MPDVFVNPKWLNDRLDEITVVDVRQSWDYDQSHVPGAVNIAFDEFRDPTDQNRGKLPPAESFAELLGNKGISREDSIVAYDGDYGVYASRFLVTAEVFGHDLDRLFLLNGDYPKWTNEFRTTSDQSTAVSSEYRTTGELAGTLISADELESAIDSDAVILDTRDPVEYHTVHIPGAKNFQWEWLVDQAARRLKPQSELKDVLSSHRIDSDQPVLLYCNTARRLSFVYAVLRDLGYDSVRFYEGGIDAWAKYGGPLETGA